MMTFDECVAQANAGKVCQMMAPNGKWVKFDPKKVINKFRIAPELTPNDGLKVLVYALHQLEQRVDAFFRDSGRWVDLPEHGHKKDPFITYGHKGYLGGEQRYVIRDDFDDVGFGRFRGHLDDQSEYKPTVDRNNVRLRDIFRSYFRIVEESNNGMTLPMGDADKCYRVVMLRLDDRNGNWHELFKVMHVKFKPGDQYNPISSSKEEYESDWCIYAFNDFFVPGEDEKEKSRPEFEPRTYSSQSGSRTFHRDGETVRLQRIPTISKITPCGDDIFHNLAMYLINYLSMLSDMDMNMDNFSDFIETNMEKTNKPTHTVRTPDWKKATTGKSIVCYHQFDEFSKYRDAVLGKLPYGNYSANYYQTTAIILRYFNNKYHGTIDEISTR